MKTGTTVPYATRRFNEHILRFNRLYDDLRANKLGSTAKRSLARRRRGRDNIFPNIDYRIYAS